MTSELQQLTDAAFEVADAARRGGGRALAKRCERLATRLVEGRFNVTVLGEFKRGKSTLVNALVGEEVLPTGVLPLTAVATEVRFGDPGARVLHADGRAYEIALDEVADYVTEERNPENERGVALVEVSVPSSLLEPGAVLVDTPGLGSIHHHNDEEAARAMLDADGAILVLSADAPVSSRELDLVAQLAERRGPTFFVLNKIDHLSSAEVDEVRRFVSDAIARSSGDTEHLWCLSARAGLDCGGGGRPGASGAAEGFAQFRSAFDDFVRNELAGARLETARAELSRLAHELDDALSVESRALGLDAADLAAKVDGFERAAVEQRQQFEDERTLLARDVKVLLDELGYRLERLAAAAPATYHDELATVARSTPVRRLEDELDAAVEAAVREGFDRLRRAECDRVEAEWAAIADRFRMRTATRVAAVRAVASDLFSVSLPAVPPPPLSAEDTRFFYLFVRVEPMREELARAVRWLLPPAVVRSRLLGRAVGKLASEFDKHAGRARWDLSQRLAAAQLRFEVAMRRELDAQIDAILAAAARASELHGASEVAHDRYIAESGVARKAARRALLLTEAGRDRA